MTLNIIGYPICEGRGGSIFEGGGGGGGGGGKSYHIAVGCLFGMYTYAYLTCCVSPPPPKL